MKLRPLLLLFALMTHALMAEEVVLQNGLNGYEGGSDATLNGEVEKLRVYNFGHAEILEVAGVAAGGMRRLVLIQFQDLVGEKRIPSGKSIQSARLELYKIKDMGTAATFSQLKENQRFLYAYGMQRSWAAGRGDGELDPEGVAFGHVSLDDEVPVYWGEANQIETGPVKGVDYQLLPFARAPLEQGIEAAWMQWDVTEFVREWASEAEKNPGLFLTARSFYVGAQFASCESPDQELRPRLVVSY